MNRPLAHLPTHLPTHRALSHFRTRGVSMIEAMCTLAIAAVLAGGALPMLNDLRASQALRGVAALLETDIQYAKSEAATGGRPVRLSVQALPGGNSCYVVHTGPAHACRCQTGGQAVCEAGATLLRLAEQGGPAGISLAPVSRSILFDASKGTVTPTASWRISDRDGRAIHQVVNIMGRVRSCTPTAGFAGLKSC